MCAASRSYLGLICRSGGGRDATLRCTERTPFARVRTRTRARCSEHRPAESLQAHTLRQTDDLLPIAWLPKKIVV